MCIASHEKMRYAAYFQDCIDCGDAVAIALSDIDHHQVGLARQRRATASASVVAISHALWPRLFGNFLKQCRDYCIVLDQELVEHQLHITCVLKTALKVRYCSSFASK